VLGTADQVRVEEKDECFRQVPHGVNAYCSLCTLRHCIASPQANRLADTIFWISSWAARTWLSASSTWECSSRLSCSRWNLQNLPPRNIPPPPTTKSRLRWVGVESSAYSVAKSLVIWQILRAAPPLADASDKPLRPLHVSVGSSGSAHVRIGYELPPESQPVRVPFLCPSG